MKIINPEKYIQDLNKSYELLKDNKYDCIIALKRSGWILGSFLSNKFNIPVFCPGEIEGIEGKFRNILILDDKACTGKSIKKVIRKILNYNEIYTFVMYKEKDKLYAGLEYFNFSYLEKLDGIYKMWYEI